MTDKPIIFSAPMVRALLDGSKTQTRRILKPQPDHGELQGWLLDTNEILFGHSTLTRHCQRIKLPIREGDRLWVRENFQAHSWAADCVTIRYFAEIRTKGFTDQIEQIKYPDGDRNAFKYIAPKGPDTWRPSIHMPRWASRLTLAVTDVRVERLQDISKEDALAEGVHPDLCPDEPRKVFAENMPAHLFGMLWESINGVGSWDQNPWVIAYTFTVEKRNIDQCA